MDIKVYKKCIKMVKNMAKERYNKDIYNTFYKHMKLTCFAYFGKDWYLNYKIEDDKLIIIDWLASNNGREKERMIPMLKAFSTILINHKGIINATLRHGTSWKIYKDMKEKGYLEEIDEYLFIDQDSSIATYINSLIPFENPDNLNELLEKNDMEKYYPYFLHETSFRITDKFIKRYKKFVI